MFGKAHSIVISKISGTIEDMCLSVLSQIDARSVIKISFFGKANGDNEYLCNFNKLKNAVNTFYTNNAPLVSYIAQESSTGKLVAEVTHITDDSISIDRHRNFVILRNAGHSELITGGIIPDDISKNTYEQAKNIFKGIDKLLKSNNFEPCDIYRQWNYIQGITVLNDGSQNYQEFNDARSIFYSSDVWNNGYPAATGIGTGRGGVMIEFSAIKEEEVPNKPIDNPMQVAAHNYSPEVLDGKVIEELKERTTPKFERARLLGSTIFISGTAAIKGEHSNHSTNAVEQTAETMEIMDRLVSKENIPVANNGSHYRFLRVYVKNECAIPAVREFMEAHYPTVCKQYLVADICRPELLVEIEGLAHI
jgi:enamine deaminase RidA (YjgF/YER057c/UK114 family)